MLRILFWTVIIVLFLSFFGVSIQGLIENPTTQTNMGFVLGLVEEGWDSIWGLIVGFVATVTGIITGIIPG
ncbi:MAG TPA: hypothetical protein VGB97_01005 [Candidatus Paceibacterota bacterium]|jgi:hypothetical protein